MPLPELRLLISKEWRELSVSRAFPLLLIAISLLVGHAFITAVETYAEMSGAGGGSAALAQGLSPLDGILVPTFGAYDLAATLLFPFVAIRLFAAERSSGARNVLVQSPASVRTMVWMKAAVLSAAWAVALIPGLAALLLWRFYGGQLAAPELAALLLGHALRALLTISLAAAAAALTTQLSTAAIVTLALTVGSWALDFIAATRGGAVERVAQFTPAAMLRLFEQGLVRGNAVLVALAISGAALALATVWLVPGLAPIARARRTGIIVLAAALLTTAAALVPWSWDVTEDRRHSFSEADESALRQLRQPLRVEVHLAPEDPRLTDLKRGVLDKVARVMPVSIVTATDSRTGMFAAADPHYGEVWYELAGKRQMERSAIEPVVLATIFNLAGVAAPAQDVTPGYRGYPNKSGPDGAAILFFALIPACIVLVFWRSRRG